MEITLTDEERRMFSNRLRERDAEIERLRGEIESWKALVAKYEGYTDARRALEPKP